MWLFLTAFGAAYAVIRPEHWLANSIIVQLYCCKSLLCALVFNIDL